MIHTIGKQRGFTIIELLIVIVVIAILASITIVAYNGIQQRANNAAMKSNVSSIVTLLRLYHAEHGVFPYDGSNSNHCATADNVCTMYNGTVMTNDNSTFVSNLSAYGTLLQSVTHFGTTVYGVYYTWSDSFTYNGDSSPVLLVFWLRGTNQDCSGVSGAVSVVGNGAFTPGPRSNGDTANGLTRCYEVITS